MAYGLAKHWKVAADSIKNIWTANKEFARDLGTAIHHMRETKTGGDVHDYYQEAIDAVTIATKRFEENKKVGATIKKNSKSAERNYAYSKHEELRDLIGRTDAEVRTWMEEVERDFVEIDRYKDHALVPECYVTYSPYNMGGEVDRLVIIDEKDKTCIIEDYKFQHSIPILSANNKMINELAKSKATKLDIIQLQLSFYAFCLYKAGWTVVVANVYGREGKWESYSVELIDMDEMDKLLVKYLN